MTAPRHCAQFNPKIIKAMAGMLTDEPNLLDPFAGKGGIFKLLDYKPTLNIQAVEIQPKWAAVDGRIYLGSVFSLPWPADYFRAVATSPTYGNRMADHHDARDGSKRNTYTHAYGEKLELENSGTLQWGPEYRDFHARAWLCVRRVLCLDGTFILNIKDHYRDGYRRAVTSWHINCLNALGFDLRRVEVTGDRGLRQGRNHALRVPEGEAIIKFTLIDKSEFDIMKVLRLCDTEMSLPEWLRRM